jgi:hypothetical protein
MPYTLKMKNFLLCTLSGVVLLASCQKNELVRNESKSKIDDVVLLIERLPSLLFYRTDP